MKVSLDPVPGIDLANAIIMPIPSHINIYGNVVYGHQFGPLLYPTHGKEKGPSYEGPSGNGLDALIGLA